MNITMLRCKAGTTGPCNDNAEHFLEVLHCERFHKDASGPWFMLSDGMTDAKCGEKTVSQAVDEVHEEIGLFGPSGPLIQAYILFSGSFPFEKRKAQGRIPNKLHGA